MKQKTIQNKKMNNKFSNKKQVKTNLKKKTSSANKSKKLVKSKKSKLRRKLLLWTNLIIILVIAIILFFRSSIFNIKEIKVEKNSKISTQQIIEISGLKIDMNMFELSSKKIEKIMKEKNSYIESVTVKKNLSGIITLEITERETNYMLDLGEKFGYINNQGYILEISTEKLNIPIITGYSTKDIIEGERLIKSDLEKLDTVIEIIEVCKSQNIYEKINSIDISDDQNYTLMIENNSKKVYFGDKTVINEKILWLTTILEKEEGIAGEVYINNMNKIYFREKV